MDKMLVKKRVELLQDLYDHADAFLNEHFGMDLNIPIRINGRLRSTGGRFRYMNVSNGIALDIEIAKFICENATIEEILSVLEHECVHYALFEQGEPHTDNDKYFIDTCKRLNVVLTHRIVKEHHIYACPTCRTRTDHYRKIPKGYYMTCKHCKGKISQEHLITIKNMKVRQLI